MHLSPFPTRPRAAVLLLAAAALLLTACGGEGGVSREDAAAEIQEVIDVDEEQAECMLDAVGDDVPYEAWTEDEEPSAEETKAMTDAYTECIISPDEEGGEADPG